VSDEQQTSGREPAGQKPAATAARSWRRPAVEYAIIAVCAIALALLIQAFVVKPYRIPSESMTNTLKVGDRVLVNRVVYHFRHPRRGDIIVFQSHAVGMTLIKRVIGVPGDTLSLSNGSVYVNGRRLNEPYVLRVNGVATATEPFTDGQPWSLAKPYTVPPGHYFVMGDNRSQSDDSRDWGPLPASELIGEAFFRYWPLNRFGPL
jgi:signal peptidase I